MKKIPLKTQIHIPFINSVLKYFIVFKGYAGVNLYILIIMVVVSGLFEGIGIGLILPVLNYSPETLPTDNFSRNVFSFINLLGLPRTLWSLLLIMVIIFFMKGALMYLQVLFTTKITTGLSKKLRVSISNKYSRMSYIFFLNQTIGYFNNILTNEVDRTVSGLAKYCEIISNFIYILIYFSVAAYIDIKLTGIVFLISIVSLFSFKFLYRLTAKYSMEITNANSVMQTSIIQIMNNYKYLKSTNSFKAVLNSLSKHISKLANYFFRIGALGGILQSLFEPFAVLFVCSLIFYHVVISGEPLIELLVLLIIFQRTFTKFFSTQISWQKFNSTIGGVHAVTKIQEVLDEEAGKNKQTGKKTIELGDIEFKNVNYSFGNKQVLFDVNLKIIKNMSVAIVGESGAGKTTFFDLLTGLLNPQIGKIFINGTSLNELNSDNFRLKIGYVTQEPVIFNDTISNNISFWTNNDKNIKSKIEHAATLSYCTEFINSLPEGFDTVIGEKGVKISGGQRQRIAIAREIFKNPEILIFDEATSSLDTESEQYIQKSIDAMIGKCTIIIIAHRLSTIKNCDYIYVLSKGRIVEEGKFDELYSIQNGLFRKMCLAQQI